MLSRLDSNFGKVSWYQGSAKKPPLRFIFLSFQDHTLIIIPKFNGWILRSKDENTISVARLYKSMSIYSQFSRESQPVDKVIKKTIKKFWLDMFGHNDPTITKSTSRNEPHSLSLIKIRYTLATLNYPRKVEFFILMPFFSSSSNSGKAPSSKSFKIGFKIALNIFARMNRFSFVVLFIGIVWKEKPIFCQHQHKLLSFCFVNQIFLLRLSTFPLERFESRYFSHQ